LRRFIYGRFEKDIIEALKTGKYTTEKIYSDISRVEYDMRFPEFASATITYYEDDKEKTAVEKVMVVMIMYEFSEVSPEVFISAYTSKIDIKNPNRTMYAMAGEIVTALWSPALKLLIKTK
jgi:hypothetical protein